MKLCSISSGSSGNCIYVGSDTSHILIDVGISGKRASAGLDLISVDPKELTAILVTHEHSDHISGVGVMARRYRCPVYGTRKTLGAMLESRSIGKIAEEQLFYIEAGSSFEIGDITVTATPSRHDAVDPVFYTFVSGNRKISVATDLGTYNDDIKTALSGSNALFIEANHDIRMLEAGPYPYFLKQRILSDIGHLSNENSGRLICELAHEGLQDVILGHLSHENNMPDVALESVRCEIKNWHQDLAHVKLHVAGRHTNSILVTT